MSRLLISCDDYCYCANGKYFLRSFDHTLFMRYLQVFDNVRVVVRTKYVDELELGAYCIPVASNMEIIPLEFFQGPLQLLKVANRITKQLHNVADGCDACIVRLPSSIAFLIHRIARKKNMPIGIEVVANPQEQAQYGSLLSRICWKLLHYNLKSSCAKADAVSYVTKYTLQKIYPARKQSSYTTHYSSAEIRRDFYTSPRSGINKDYVVICHVANPINTWAKGHDVFIETIKQLREKYNCSVVGRIVGDGPLLPSLKDYVKKCGMEEYISFDGYMTPPQLYEVYLESDIMLFPTLTEGLPRVLIEAMATGMPCLSTPVGGIPELLEEKDLFHPKDVSGFANRIAEIITNRDEYTSASRVGFEKSLEYAADVLSMRRREMFEVLKQMSHK